MDWERKSWENGLSEDYIRNHKDQLNWVIISKNQKLSEPFIEEMKDKVKVGKVNVDEQAELAMRYGIMSIPTVMVFKGGEPVQTSVGLVPKDALLKLL